MNFESLIASGEATKKCRISENTRKVYERCLKRYKTLSSTIPDFPDPENITCEKAIAFLEYYRKLFPKTTYGYLRNFSTSFSYWCKEKKLPNFTLDIEFKNYMAGLQHKMRGGFSPNAKKPITPEILKKLSDNIRKDNSIDVQFITICSLCFYGFLRINECLAIDSSDVRIDEQQRMVLCIRISKTDQTGLRTYLYIHKTETPYSPFIWYPLHLQMNGISPNGKIFHWSDDTFRRHLKEKRSAICEDVSQFSTHSFRKGAATAASQAKIPLDFIKSMGRWRSTCFFKYTVHEMEEVGKIVTQTI